MNPSPVSAAAYKTPVIDPTFVYQFLNQNQYTSELSGTLNLNLPSLQTMKRYDQFMTPLQFLQSRPMLPSKPINKPIELPLTPHQQVPSTMSNEAGEEEPLDLTKPKSQRKRKILPPAFVATGRVGGQFSQTAMYNVNGREKGQSNISFHHARNHNKDDTDNFASYRKYLGAKIVRPGKPSSVSMPRIKRPMNAFILWSHIEREKISKANPDLHNIEISKVLGTTWKAMSDIQKAPYFQEQSRLSKAHMQIYPGYRYTPRAKRFAFVDGRKVGISMYKTIMRQKQEGRQNLGPKGDLNLSSENSGSLNGISGLGQFVCPCGK